jgi:transcriptional regulator with XRE-family HTH domain
MTDPRSFGAWLRRERERRSITLRLIADRTKIGVGLLEGLERGDVSRWPGGIYRRAFVRGYAETVGLDAELVLANFEKVFQEDPPAAEQRAAPIELAAEPDEMRLALAVRPTGVSRSSLKTAGRDLAMIGGVALGGLVAGGIVWFWCFAAVAASALHVAHVLGLSQRSIWQAARDRFAPEAPARAAVVQFTDEKARATSRRARARRVLADLSAAASSAANTRRRRAARS